MLDQPKVVATLDESHEVMNTFKKNDFPTSSGKKKKKKKGKKKLRIEKAMN